MKDVLRILGLWRGRALWLAAGVIVSLAALGAGVGMMALGGAMLGAAVAAGVLAAPLALRVLGAARVVLRYARTAASRTPRRSARWPICGYGSSAISRAAPPAALGSVRQAMCWPGWSATSRRSTGSIFASWCRSPGRFCCSRFSSC